MHHLDWPICIMLWRQNSRLPSCAISTRETMLSTPSVSRYSSFDSDFFVHSIYFIKNLRILSPSCAAIYSVSDVGIWRSEKARNAYESDAAEFMFWFCRVTCGLRSALILIAPLLFCIWNTCRHSDPFFSITRFVNEDVKRTSLEGVPVLARCVAKL